MDIMVGYLSRMIFHCFDLPLPVFRRSKGSIWIKLSLQQLRRPYRIHTPLVSANAVIMWCMECILWISYRMRLLDRAPVCMGGEDFFGYRDFGFCFSLESSGWLRVCRAGSRSGRPCMHASIAVPRGGAWSASHPWSPDLTCAVRGAWVLWIPSAQAAVFRCTIAVPRHRTLRYPTRTGPTVPCLPAPCPSSSVCP
jgi:hypothetical protein